MAGDQKPSSGSSADSAVRTDGATGVGESAGSSSINSALATDGATKSVDKGAAHDEMRSSGPDGLVFRVNRNHILRYPDAYIGSIKKQVKDMWIFNATSGLMTLQSVCFSSGLQRIFDEILVNAADNKARGMTTLQVTINKQRGSISVRNNGLGISCEQDNNTYLPEILFTQLGASCKGSQKKMGGINGLGAKLTNIFSRELEIQIAQGAKVYQQKFTDNMSNIPQPVFSDCEPSENWTQVTFFPDHEIFGSLEEGDISLMEKRTFDIAGTSGDGVEVFFNSVLVPSPTFMKYVELYIGSEGTSTATPRLYENICEGLDVCLALSKGEFQQVSFVNGVATLKGGCHVDRIMDQITSKVLSFFNENHRLMKINDTNVKSYLWIFINSVVDYPAFDSQSKETLMNSTDTYGSSWDLPDEFLEKVLKLGIVEKLLSSVDHEKVPAGFAEIPKQLIDAKFAGGKYSDECTLILTEGNSAKSLAMAGLAILGRDRYGVYPLRGKFRNVKDASDDQLKHNKEVNRIKLILGLEESGHVYTSTGDLRYGHVMIMADQDHDGSHLKGLVINLFHTMWPSLLKIDGFLLQFVTPIVKVTIKSGNSSPLYFYSIPEYRKWREAEGQNASDWRMKYYKGLGTSTCEEARRYFKDIEKHTKIFVWEGEEDDVSLELAFSHKKSKERKQWLMDFQPGSHISPEDKRISYRDFIYKELILYSLADNERSIPLLIDGLKPSQRKILYCCFTRNLTEEIKVTILAGYVSEISAYQHGEQSLEYAIIGMAQDFVGSNNINFLQPHGQFGTRYMAGKDAATARYLYTSLSPITRSIFPKEDEPLLNFLNEDGQITEPMCYLPILPPVLINGCDGIGTGWSSTVHNYDAKDIVYYLEEVIRSQGSILDKAAMIPFYRGFKGFVTKRRKEGHFFFDGLIYALNSTTLKITELPIGTSLEEYYVFLESMLRKNMKEERNCNIIIEEILIEGDDVNIDIKVILNEDIMMEVNKLSNQKLKRLFKLRNSFTTTNMHLFNEEGKIQHYSTAESIIWNFYIARLPFYEKREVAREENYQNQLKELENKIKFITDINDGRISLNKENADLIADLKAKGFEPIKKEKAPAEDACDYGYLLELSAGQLNKSYASVLESQKLNLENGYTKMTAHELWLLDLDNFKRELSINEENYKNAQSKRVEVTLQHGKSSKRTEADKTADGEEEEPQLDPLAPSLLSEEQKKNEMVSKRKKLKLRSISTRTEGGSSTEPTELRRSDRLKDDRPVDYHELASGTDESD